MKNPNPNPRGFMIKEVKSEASTDNKCDDGDLSAQREAYGLGSDGEKPDGKATEDSNTTREPVSTFFANEKKPADNVENNSNKRKEPASTFFANDKKCADNAENESNKPKRPASVFSSLPNKKPAGMTGRDPNKPKTPTSAHFIFLGRVQKTFIENNPHNKLIKAYYQKLAEENYAQDEEDCVVSDEDNEESC
ncbi:hypothetical protein IFM89_025789 [Coptis chinensis]|uniref:Uncharacterized protein n=1 Tax=Coptis chinensis TaxID=261450 RepID=A0A835HH21_9MAGN|nr:hypothetical protein IFM89_025789 [Coptis chinensis]